MIFNYNKNHLWTRLCLTSPTGQWTTTTWVTAQTSSWLPLIWVSAYTSQGPTIPILWRHPHKWLDNFHGWFVPSTTPSYLKMIHSRRSKTPTTKNYNPFENTGNSYPTRYVFWNGILTKFPLYDISFSDWLSFPPYFFQFQIISQFPYNFKNNNLRRVLLSPSPESFSPYFSDFWLSPESKSWVQNV